jgi:predicted HicB family RNase H-like nuclease
MQDQDDDEELPLLAPKYNDDGSIRGNGRRKKARVAFGTRLRPEVIRMAKAQTRQTGEYLNEFLTRLIKAESQRNPVSMD